MEVCDQMQKEFYTKLRFVPYWDKSIQKLDSRMNAFPRVSDSQAFIKEIVRKVMRPKPELSLILLRILNFFQMIFMLKVFLVTF